MKQFRILPTAELEWLFSTSLEYRKSSNIDDLKSLLPAVYWELKKSPENTAGPRASREPVCRNESVIIHETLSYQSTVFSELVAKQHNSKLQLIYIQLVPSKAVLPNTIHLPEEKLFSVIYPVMLELTIIRLCRYAECNGAHTVFSVLINKDLVSLFENMGFEKMKLNKGDDLNSVIESGVKRFPMDKKLGL
ncbi:hypothetical protein NBRC116494_23860 [Aurantivibrio plasticivorans]